MQNSARLKANKYNCNTTGNVGHKISGYQISSLNASRLTAESYSNRLQTVR
jgi:hypothetical protein